MKRVLFVSYFFPPLGGGGVQRSVKFVRYIPEHGWEPVVLTVRRTGYWITDETLLSEVPAGTRVVRTFSLDGPNALSWLDGGARHRHAPGRGETRSAGRSGRLRGLAGWLLVPDVYRPWKPFALRAARRILREEAIDAIYTTSSPDSAHLVGLDLSRESGLPWIADFRDPWTRRISFTPPTALHRRWHESLERKVLLEARRVVVTTDETRADMLARYPALDPARVAVIPNGFDPEDFDEPMPPPDPRRFTLVHLGQLTAGRTVDPLVPVLQRFFAMEPNARRDTRVRCVGPREVENDRLIELSGLTDVVGFEPSRPHREALALASEASVLVILEQPSERGGLIAQGKLYEALYSMRPILALVPAGATRRILETAGAGCAAGSAEVERAAEFLAVAYRAWRDRTPLRGAARESLGRFERRALALDLCGILDEACR